MIACLKHKPATVEYPMDYMCPLCAAQAALIDAMKNLTAAKAVLEQQRTDTERVREWAQNVRPGGQLVALHGITESATCETCANLLRRGYAARCALTTRTNSASTDWRIDWQACGKYESDGYDRA